jgi:1-pyrroline-5-carboxylate dehydrogenase
LPVGDFLVMAHEFEVAGRAESRPGNRQAGAPQNLLRWTSPRSIKETFVPPKEHGYPHMG